MLKRISEEEFIAFDLETTGLHPVFSRIIEIGAVRFRGDGTVLDSFQQLIDPKCAITPGAMAVNGISNEMGASFIYPLTAIRAGSIKHFGWTGLLRTEKLR